MLWEVCYEIGDGWCFDDDVECVEGDELVGLVQCFFWMGGLEGGQQVGGDVGQQVYDYEFGYVDVEVVDGEREECLFCCIF